MKDKHLILVIDDEKIICETYKMQLHLNEYQIITKNSAKAGLDFLEVELPDLILLDVMMPEMDGFQACKLIKSNPKWKHIPIILITALEGKNNLIKGLESGADEFLSKPVNGPELRARVRSMLRIKDQYDELEENMKIREQLSHVIMHDIRNPLLSIAMLCEVSIVNLANGFDIDVINKNLHNVMKEAKNLNSFINDMLLVTKIESGKLKLNKHETSMKELIMQSVSNHKIIANRRGINIKYDQSSDQEPMCNIDYNLFLRVIDNVVSNALKYSPNNSKIDIFVNDTGKSIEIRISDEGIGIKDEAKEKIFTKYETGKIFKKGELQTGIGLAFCKMVVEAHKGNILAQDNNPKGAIFIITLHREEQ